jgi:predicted GIY-YIG superfamily endonuclease
MNGTSKKWHIYILRDPRNGEARYVGRTSRLSARRWEHLASGASGPWVSELIRDGLKPKMHVVQTLHSAREADEAEREWICGMRVAGARLFNRILLGAPT